MALPEIRGVARLLTQPTPRTTTTGKPWTSALAKFETWTKGDDGKWAETEGVVASLAAFDDAAEPLAGYAKGDKVAVHGTARPAVWQDKPQLKVSVIRCWTPEEKP